MFRLLRALFRLAQALQPTRPPARPNHRPTDPGATFHDPVIRKLRGHCHVIDGDTIVIANRHVRIAGIDAPELDDPWGQKSKWAMVALCKGQIITADIVEVDHFDRTVAQCFLTDGRDLAAEIVAQGHAIDWPKYSGGRYRPLEPKGTRKRLWRCVARQRGEYHNRTHP